MSRGFILTEVAIAYIVLTLAIAALVPVFIMAVRANKNTEHTQMAVHLAAELLEEVRLRKWDTNSPSPAAYVTVPSSVLGPEGGESATDKRTFDDVDDFNGWAESGVLDPVMRPLAAFSSYSRSVTVSYVTPALAASGVATDYKRIQACAWTPRISPVCLDTVVTNR